MIINTETGEIYIGCTTTCLRRRMSEHRHGMKRYPDTLLYQSMNEYGFEKFEWIKILVYYCSNIDELHKREIEVIQEIKPTLNTCTKLASEYEKEYYHRNKEKINKKVVCEYCNAYTCKKHLNAHLNSNNCKKARGVI